MNLVACAQQHYHQAEDTTNTTKLKLNKMESKDSFKRVEDGLEKKIILKSLHFIKRFLYHYDTKLNMLT